MGLVSSQISHDKTCNEMKMIWQKGLIQNQKFLRSILPKCIYVQTCIDALLYTIHTCVQNEEDEGLCCCAFSSCLMAEKSKLLCLCKYSKMLKLVLVLLLQMYWTVVSICGNDYFAAVNDFFSPVIYVLTTDSLYKIYSVCSKFRCYCNFSVIKLKSFWSFKFLIWLDFLNFYLIFFNY